ncbi:hypothetical protein LguiA_017660 [Lonicera macranthoides]
MKRAKITYQLLSDKNHSWEPETEKVPKELVPEGVDDKVSDKGGAASPVNTHDKFSGGAKRHLAPPPFNNVTETIQVLNLLRFSCVSVSSNKQSNAVKIHLAPPFALENFEGAKSHLVAGVNSASHAFGPSFANKKIITRAMHRREPQKPCFVLIGSQNLRGGLKLQICPQLLRKDSVLEAEGGKGELIIYKNGKLMLTNKALEKLIIRLGIWED